jgi:hypothetical protein
VDYFVEEVIMAQVSDSTTSLQETIGALQSKSPRQNQPVSPDSGETAENGRSNRLDTQKESNNTRQARQTEDRVQISSEAQQQTRESRVEEGARNVDNLRPPSEQRESERGAAQRLSDQNQTPPSGTRSNEGGGNQVQPESPSGNGGQEANAQRNRTESREQAQVRDQIKEDAADRTKSETRLREFQTKDEIQIEPQKVSQSVEEIAGQRERAEAAKETVFETPSQRIIQEEAPADSGSEQTRSAENNARSDQARSNRQPPSPTSVQTETGQNVDDLI